MKKTNIDLIITELDPNWVRIDNRQKLAEKRAKQEEEKKAKKIRTREIKKEIKQEKKAGINPPAKNAIKNMFSNYEKKERPDPAVLFNQPSTSQG